MQPCVSILDHTTGVLNIYFVAIFFCCDLVTPYHIYFLNSPNFIVTVEGAHSPNGVKCGSMKCKAKRWWASSRVKIPG